MPCSTVSLIAQTAFAQVAWPVLVPPDPRASSAYNAPPTPCLLTVISPHFSFLDHVSPFCLVASSVDIVESRTPASNVHQQLVHPTRELYACACSQQNGFFVYYTVATVLLKAFSS